MALTEFSIRTRDVTMTPARTRVVRRWWCRKTDLAKGAGGWQIPGLPNVADALDIPGMTFRTNETPVAVLVKIVPRLSEQRAGAYAIYQMSKMA